MRWDTPDEYFQPRHATIPSRWAHNIEHGHGLRAAGIYRRVELKWPTRKLKFIVPEHRSPIRQWTATGSIFAQDFITS
jgi:hypothetical protein